MTRIYYLSIDLRGQVRITQSNLLLKRDTVNKDSDWPINPVYIRNTCCISIEVVALMSALECSESFVDSSHNENTPRSFITHTNRANKTKGLIIRYTLL